MVTVMFSLMKELPESKVANQLHNVKSEGNTVQAIRTKPCRVDAYVFVDIL